MALVQSIESAPRMELSSIERNRISKRKFYWAHREEEIERHKKYSKEQHEYVKRVWGMSQRGHSSQDVKTSEEFVAQVMVDEGFKEVMVTRTHWGPYFPFDIIAKRDGEVYGIDATLSWRGKITEAQALFAKMFGLRMRVYNVKPAVDMNYSAYYAKDLFSARQFNVPMSFIRNLARQDA